MDNSAIERIAMPDLTDDTLALLKKYGGNDDVVFFLGRLVWQGEMVECATPLMEIACDGTRGRYARIAAIRGVMAVGNDEQKNQVWKAIAEDIRPIDRAILSELMDWAPANIGSVDLLLRLLEHAAAYERHNPSGFEHAIHAFIDLLPVMTDEADDHPLGRLVEGLNKFLSREPLIERGECHVSEEFAWLMPAALHAVDRLVAARSVQALDPSAISIMRNMPALRFWQGEDYNDYKSSLSKNVPRWRDLNDLLYWSSVAAYRAKLADKGDALTDDWQMAFIGHFWAFGPEDFERCLEWVRTKDGDDKAVALSRCIQLYFEADRPAAWLAPLRAAVVGEEKLQTAFESRLKPKPSPAMEEMEAEHKEWQREHDRKERKQKKDRSDWVRALKKNPDRVLHPPGIQPGEMSGDQYHLLLSTMGSGSSFRRDDGAGWRTLINEFGERVACAYRDAAIAHWRTYHPALRSEGGDSGSIPYSLIFAMSGLAIEASEDSAFAQRLTPDEAKLAFRYVPWELNGFPAWLEPLYRTFPNLGFEALTKELLWELEHSGTEPLHYVLHDIVYHAPWLHADLAPLILDWLRAHDMPNADALRYCMRILMEGGVSSVELAQLAGEKVEKRDLGDQAPRWFALWVDTDPGTAIPKLTFLLEAMPFNEASAFAEHFIVSLVGDRHERGTQIGAFRDAQHLKALYVLMHRYILISDDIDRMDKGAYSPTLRDNAQDARGRLFNMLVAVPGPEAYAAIKALENEHPEPSHRRWMAVRARERATQDADEPLWTTEQVRDFERR